MMRLCIFHALLPLITICLKERTLVGHTLKSQGHCRPHFNVISIATTLHSAMADYS